MIFQVAGFRLQVASPNGTCNLQLVTLLTLLATVAAEGTRRSKLTEFVTYHVLRNVDGDVGFTVVNGDGQTYHIRNDHGRA
jgi:hypothetical protein